ncbi:hypothetical protein [Natronorubrum texcoconense]|uniref:Uncharacterized protein n=1 Tax=Natronorubrum texcoconense TaxID=1095776 RepID=A0A1G9F6G9_9EURY|nr:hypothetical protein [Natronorubrum texcoconense]SDK83941.1 hypothetical protein SAMN04515672_4104 [Natronorubrum texcoconense]
MPTIQEYPRLLVVCDRCRSPLVARELPNGTLRPIGSGKTCPCGCGEFSIYE